MMKSLIIRLSILRYAISYDGASADAEYRI